MHRSDASQNPEPQVACLFKNVFSTSSSHRKAPTVLAIAQQSTLAAPANMNGNSHLSASVAGGLRGAGPSAGLLQPSCTVWIGQSLKSLIFAERWIGHSRIPILSKKTPCLSPYLQTNCKISLSLAVFWTKPSRIIKEAKI